jgi:hypothetical protein
MCFQQQPLLRIHEDRLARTHAKELGVEATDVVEEAAARYTCAPCRVGAVLPTPGGPIRRFREPDQAGVRAHVDGTSSHRESSPNLGGRHVR